MYVLVESLKNCERGSHQKVKEKKLTIEMIGTVDRGTTGNEVGCGTRYTNAAVPRRLNEMLNRGSCLPAVMLAAEVNIEGGCTTKL